MGSWNGENCLVVAKGSAKDPELISVELPGLGGKTIVEYCRENRVHVYQPRLGIGPAETTDPVWSVHGAPPIFEEAGKMFDYLVQSQSAKLAVVFYGGCALQAPGVAVARSNALYPWIGVPAGSNWGGAAPFLSLAETPRMTPVATVGVDRPGAQPVQRTLDKAVITAVRMMKNTETEVTVIEDQRSGYMDDLCQTLGDLRVNHRIIQYGEEGITGPVIFSHDLAQQIDLQGRFREEIEQWYGVMAFSEKRGIDQLAGDIQLVGSLPPGCVATYYPQNAAMLMAQGLSFADPELRHPIRTMRRGKALDGKYSVTGDLNHPQAWGLPDDGMGGGLPLFPESVPVER